MKIFTRAVFSFVKKQHFYWDIFTYQIRHFQISVPVLMYFTDNLIESVNTNHKSRQAKCLPLYPTLTILYFQSQSLYYTGTNARSMDLPRRDVIENLCTPGARSITMWALNLEKRTFVRNIGAEMLQLFNKYTTEENSRTGF
jgi:hypothetical protein